MSKVRLNREARLIAEFKFSLLEDVVTCQMHVSFVFFIILPFAAIVQLRWYTWDRLIQVSRQPGLDVWCWFRLENGERTSPNGRSSHCQLAARNLWRVKLQLAYLKSAREMGHWSARLCASTSPPRVFLRNVGHGLFIPTSSPDNCSFGTLNGFWKGL